MSSNRLRRRRSMQRVINTSASFAEDRPKRRMRCPAAAGSSGPHRSLVAARRERSIIECRLSCLDRAASGRTRCPSRFRVGSAFGRGRCLGMLLLQSVALRGREALGERIGHFDIGQAVQRLGHFMFFLRIHGHFRCCLGASLSSFYCWSLIAHPPHPSTSHTYMHVTSL